MKTFITRTRARYAETDTAEVLYYGSYFLYFEVGRIEMFRELGLPYRKDIPIVDTYCKYLRPGYFDDLLEIHTKFDDITEKGFKIRSLVYRVMDDEVLELLAEGYVSMVYVNENRKVSLLPDYFLEAFEKIGPRK
ncbi:MAG: thioesterase family protein [Candidatus Thermoplasmatota archaeon]|jgi:acyl-CoA thioester hydrolase|nr:thioesterase family protein [Candidatus Thermoplasmatota archaeon]